MKLNWKPLVLVCSLVLNAAFIGACVFYRLAPAKAAPLSNGPFLYQELDLSKDQLARMEPVRDRFHAQIAETGNEIRKRQLALIDLLAAPNLDREALDSVRREVQALQNKMQDTVVAHVLEETGIFSPEQRGKFFRLMKERIERNSQPCPPWMKLHEDKG